MGSGCSREGFDLFNKYTRKNALRKWRDWLFNWKHYFWGDTFGRFLRPFCSHKNKTLFNDDGKDEYYCYTCKQWLN